MPLFPSLTLPSPLQKIVLIFDVDGVIREGTESPADPRVLLEIKKILTDPRVHVVFLSGTPISNNPNLETWRKGNQPLTYVFGTSLEKEIQQGRVWIYGMLGGHQMQKDGSFTVVESFSLQTTFALGKLLLETFLDEMTEVGCKEICKDLKEKLTTLTLADFNQPEDETPREFGTIVCQIREKIDPEFRLISSGGIIETQVFHPAYQGLKCLERVKKGLRHLHLPQIPYPATGVAKRDDHPFHFLLISKTHKGHTAKTLIEENKHLFPNALILTVGDTQIDFPMHERAHFAFHVGLESVWKTHPLPHCSIVLGEKGEDKQHIEGTLQVLELVQASLDKK